MGERTCDNCKHGGGGDCFGIVGLCDGPDITADNNKFEPIEPVKSCVTCQNNWGSEGNKIPCTAACGTDYHGWIPILKEEINFEEIRSMCRESMTCINSGQKKCKTTLTGCYEYRKIHTTQVPVSMPVYEGDKKHIESNGAIPINPEDHPGDGMKHDSGKTDMSLLEYFPLALKALCKVSEKGCAKYTRGSFDSVPNGRRRYTGAMQRHYYQEGPGDTPELDEELQLPHDFMVMWNAVCRVELRLRGQKLPQD